MKLKSGLKIVAIDEAARSPFLMMEPQWVPDSEVTNPLFSLQQEHVIFEVVSSWIGSCVYQLTFYCQVMPSATIMSVVRFKH